jgi:hypothetical protein
MSNYKVKEKYKGTATSFYDGYFVRWGDSSHEELAHIYENIDGGKSFIDKTTNSDNESEEKESSTSKKTTKKSSRKSKKD